MRPACPCRADVQALLRRRATALRLLAAAAVVSWPIQLLELSPARAQEAGATLGPWQATEILGTVQARPASTSTDGWQDLDPAETLTAASEVRTGPDGQVTLGNGVDLIRLAPNSLIALPVPQEDGLLTLISQKLGSLFVDVGKRPGRQFEVDAPYLVVLVKGTQFTVNLADGSDTVTVTRGTVEVRASAGGEGVLVNAGQTASVQAGGSSVSVGNSSPGNGAPGNDPSTPSGGSQGQQGNGASDTDKGRSGGQVGGDGGNDSGNGGGGLGGDRSGGGEGDGDGKGGGSSGGDGDGNGNGNGNGGGSGGGQGDGDGDGDGDGNGSSGGGSGSPGDGDGDDDDDGGNNGSGDDDDDDDDDDSGSGHHGHHGSHGHHDHHDGHHGGRQGDGCRR
jgi:hypothetical protein